MRPTHRDFRDPHPEELSGEIENLHIEGEMIYLAAAENTFGGITREELKAALRVVDAGNSHQLDHLVEGASAKFAQDGLSLDELGAFYVAGADGDVVPGIESREQFLDLFDRGGQVGIRKEEPGAAGAKDAISHRIAFPPVGLVGEEPHLRPAGGDLLHNIRGAVRAAIVSHQYFEGVVLRVEISQHPFERGSQARLLIVRRYNDGEVGSALLRRTGRLRVTRRLWTRHMMFAQENLLRPTRL